MDERQRDKTSGVKDKRDERETSGVKDIERQEG